jgi:pantoate kinase
LSKHVAKTAKAFAPAAISSFFEIHNIEDNKPITELEKVGARGGGFGLQKGVHTKVTAKEAEKNRISIFINSKPAPQAKTTRTIVEMLLAKTKKKFHVTVWHEIEVPIGTGFGTSAGGALTAGLAVEKTLELPLTYNQIGKMAHVAEIKCRTGLGTVSSLAFAGGCVLVVEPGAPGICQIDRIPLTADLMIVAGFFPSNAFSKSLLSDTQRQQTINRHGKKTLETILDKPTLENFLDSCWEFSQKTGFATSNVRKLVELAKNSGAIGATQNMLGEAVHALVKQKSASQVEEAFKQVLPSENVLLSRIDFQGARLIG